MDVNQLLAVVPVSDIEAAARWCERLLGGPPTNHPMPSLVE
jgi:glyoxylase I family protein